MISSCRDICVALVTTIIVLAIGETVTAQPSSYFEYKRAYEAAELGSDEQLDLIFKVIDVVFHYDIDMALEWSEKALELSRKADNQAAEATALMDLACWTAYKYDSTKASHYLEKANQLFDEKCDPRFRAQFLASRFGYSIVNEDEEYDPNEYLDQMKVAAEETGDPHYLMSYLYMTATSKVFVGKLSPTEPAILEIRKQLVELTEKSDYGTGKINLMLLNAQELRLKGDLIKAFMTLSRVVDYSKKEKYPLFEVRALLMIAHAETQQSYFEFLESEGPIESMDASQLGELKEIAGPIRDRYAECLKVARQVKMGAYIFESLVNLALMEHHCGNSEQALACLKEAEEMEYACFRSWVLRDTLYRHAVMVYASHSDSANSLKYANLLSSEEHLARAKEADAKALRYRQQLVASKKERQLESSQSAIRQSELVANFNDEKQRADWLQGVLLYLALALALMGLAWTWVWSRNRLQEVRSQLTDEQETSRINREMRDVLQDRVNRLQRMESLGMLAGGVAHDFNNLLVGVMGNAELLEQKNDQLDTFSAERVQQIIASAEKAADLSRQMLAYAGKQQIERKTMDLNEIAQKMSRVLTASVGEKQKVVIESGSKPLIAEVDDTQIGQVLLNLVTNASCASEVGSSVIVRTGSETIAAIGKNSELHGTRNQGGDFVFLEVEDFGSGFEVDHTDRIFEPFYSISDTGRGLGLSVVYGIVNGHDGLIRVTSKPGEGTKFRVLLPMASQAIDRVDITEKPPEFKTAAPNENARGTVLVVDDEATVRELAAALLRSKGWNVLTATDGEEGMDLLIRKQSTIDCVLLDVVMPTMGAGEVLERLDKEKIQVPIVLMSGYSDTQLDVYRRNRKIVSIVSKPFRTSELIAAVSDALLNGPPRSGRVA